MKKLLMLLLFSFTLCFAQETRSFKDGTYEIRIVENYNRDFGSVYNIEFTNDNWESLRKLKTECVKGEKVRYEFITADKEKAIKFMLKFDTFDKAVKHNKTECKNETN